MPSINAYKTNITIRSMLADIAPVILDWFSSLLQLELSLTVWLNSLPKWTLYTAEIVSNSVYLMLFLLVYFAWKNWSPRRGAYFAFTFIFSFVFSTFLKLVFDVPRPIAPNPIDVYSSSFPSRHAQLAFTGLALARDRSIRRVLPTTYFAIWALLISLSRLVLGVHYLHDVVAGAIFGYLIGQVLMKAKSQVKHTLFDLRKYPKEFSIKPEYKLELSRKTFHIFGGVLIAILALLLPEPWHVPVLFAVSVIAILLSYATKKKMKIPVVRWLVKTMERPKDLEEFPLKGSITVFIGMMLTAIFFDAKITAAAAIVLGIGDGLSTMFGILFGVSEIFYNQKKDWEGIFIGIIGAFFGLAFLYPPAIAAIGATIPMLVESMDIRIGNYRLDDNLLIPPLAGFIIWLLV